MDFSTLPYWPEPAPGESKMSWFQAAGQVQPLDERDWWEMVQPSHREPERPKEGTQWQGLPSELGEISIITPAWRLSPVRRRVYCPQCRIRSFDSHRWPTLVEWLDARQLECRKHGCPLVYLDPALGSDSGHIKCLAKPELLELYRWTRQWMRLDRCVSPSAILESQWRRDLVRLVCRNWTSARCHSAAGLGAWELWRMGWYGQEKSGALDANGPGRLGELSAPERLGSLLLAYRGWRCFRREVATIPPVPRVAWLWLTRRWERRLNGLQRARFQALAENLIANS